MAGDTRLTSQVNLARLHKAVEGIQAGLGATFAKRVIERYLVDKTKARFEPRGSNPYAQRDPSGQFWPFLSQATVTAKKYRGEQVSRSQALYGKGVLQRSISIVRALPGFVSVQTGTGAVFEIGIHPGSPARKYARFLNEGGETPTGGRVPARKFLGVSKQDANDIGLIIRNNLIRHMGQ